MALVLLTWLSFICSPGRHQVLHELLRLRPQHLVSPGPSEEARGGASGGEGTLRQGLRCQRSLWGGSEELAERRVGSRQEGVETDGTERLREGWAEKSVTPSECETLKFSFPST